jgi:hypothetical protein
MTDPGPRRGEIAPPPPPAHRDGTRDLLAAWRAAPLPPGVAALFDVALPAAVLREAHALKFDVYAVSSGAWGVTVNDRWEERAAFAARVTSCARELGVDVAPLFARAAALVAPGDRLTFALGFDGGGAVRGKLYAQEDAWGAATISADALRAQGWPLPSWISGPVAVRRREILPGGGDRRVVYLGAPTAADGARRCPEVGDLAAAMARVEDVEGWYYVSVKEREEGWEVAMNKVYNAVGIAFARGTSQLGAAREEVARLTGVGVPDVPGVVVVPTAIALQLGSADLYCAGWRADAGAPGE